MKRTLLAFVLLFALLFALSGIASAQTELCYKDLCIGMDENEARSLLNGTHPSYLTLKVNRQAILRKYDSIGDIPVARPTLLFAAGKLKTIFVDVKSPQDYERLREALIEKWGKPRLSSKEKVQNSGGETLYNALDAWKREEGTIFYEAKPEGDEQRVLYAITSKDSEKADSGYRGLSESDQKKIEIKEGL